MNSFPVNLIIKDQPVVVVGGGAVATRKCAALLPSGPRLTVIAPRIDDPLVALRERREIVHVAREYRQGDLAGAFLVFAATNEPAANRAVVAEAVERRILVCSAEEPETGTFTMPAVVRRGNLLIAVSTGGASPAMARRIREELQERYGPEYADILELLARLREKLLTDKENSAYNKRVLRELVGYDLPALFRTKSTTEIDHLLAKIFGPGYTLAGLGVGEKDNE